MRKTFFRRLIAVVALAVGIGAAGTSVSAAQAAPAHHAVVHANDWLW